MITQSMVDRHRQHGGLWQVTLCRRDTDSVAFGPGTYIFADAQELLSPHITWVEGTR